MVRAVMRVQLGSVLLGIDRFCLVEKRLDKQMLSHRLAPARPAPVALQPARNNIRFPLLG